MFEHKHIVLMKVAYRANNWRKTPRQFIKHNRKLATLKNIELAFEGFKQKTNEKVTTLYKVTSLLFLLDLNPL